MYPVNVTGPLTGMAIEIFEGLPFPGGRRRTTRADHLCRHAA
jgi:hypothetical protein